MTSTKKFFTAVLSGGVLVRCLLGAAPANADPTNAQYERDLKSAGFYADNGEGTLVSTGHSFCARMDQGASSASLVREMYTNSDLTHDAAQQFVNITISDLCPWNH